MSIEGLENILRKIHAAYNKNPLGWKVFVSTDEKGFPTILFYSPEETWEIKLDSLYKPNPLCVGLNFKNENSEFVEKIESPHYGFRPVEDDIAKRILESFSKNEVPVNVINSILKNKPKPLDEIEKNRMVLHGPVIHSHKLPLVSEKQVDLDLKLRQELQKLLMNRGIYSLYT
ncbi:MAG: hypothetical protein QXG36_07220 [Nitrososphaeria archaeon]